MTEFDTITQLGRSIFLGVSHPTSQRAEPQRSQKFLDPYLCRNGLTLTTSDEIWYDNTRGGVAGFRGSATPPSQGVGPSGSQILGTSYMRAHSMRNNNEILHGDQTDVVTRFEAFFTRSLTNADARGSS